MRYFNKDEQELLLFALKWGHYAQEFKNDLSALSSINQHKVLNLAYENACLQYLFPRAK